MFLKYILVLTFFVTGVVGAETAKPNLFVLKTLKQHLDNLVKQKKSVNQLALGEMFDDFADDTKELLKDLDKQQESDESIKNQTQDTIKMITHNMAAMQKLLTFMSVSVDLDPLNNYCSKQSDDVAWVTICNRPAKRVVRSDKKKDDVIDEERPANRLKIDHDDDLPGGY